MKRSIGGSTDPRLAAEAFNEEKLPDGEALPSPLDRFTESDRGPLSIEPRRPPCEADTARPLVRLARKLVC
jgi:hypothetical protein